MNNTLARQRLLNPVKVLAAHSSRERPRQGAAATAHKERRPRAGVGLVAAARLEAPTSLASKALIQA